ncbi:MAG: cell division protein FtsQ/DivIB [Pseudomonadota bacterium]
MARRAKRNRRVEPRARRLPSVSAVLAAARRVLRVTVVVAGLGLIGVSVWMALDRPIREVYVDAPMQRVTALEIEAVVKPFRGAGFLSVGLDEVRGAVQALPWADNVKVARRWPDALSLHVTEQVPAARWGDTGLLNMRGELFVSNARYLPPELPRLSGPKGSEWRVAQRYLDVRNELLHHGLNLVEVLLDPRGAWRLRMTNGLAVHLGIDDTDARTRRFVDVTVPLITARMEEVDYVDMRYSNGFAVGWKSAPADIVQETTP